MLIHDIVLVELVCTKIDGLVDTVIKVIKMSQFEFGEWKQ